MNVSPIFPLFNSFFELFDDALPVFKDLVSLLTSDLLVAVKEPVFPQWLQDILVPLLESSSVGGYSVLSFIIGVGVPLYLFAVVVKFIVGIFT